MAAFRSVGGGVAVARSGGSCVAVDGGAEGGGARGRVFGGVLAVAVVVVVIAAAGGDGRGTVAAGAGVVGAAVGAVAVDDESASHVALTIDGRCGFDQGFAFAVHGLFHVVADVIVAFPC